MYGRIVHRSVYPFILQPTEIAVFLWLPLFGTVRAEYILYLKVEGGRVDFILSIQYWHHIEEIRFHTSSVFSED